MNKYFEQERAIEQQFEKLYLITNPHTAREMDLPEAREHATPQFHEILKAVRKQMTDLADQDMNPWAWREMRLVEVRDSFLTCGAPFSTILWTWTYMHLVWVGRTLLLFLRPNQNFRDATGALSKSCKTILINAKKIKLEGLENQGQWERLKAWCDDMIRIMSQFYFHWSEKASRPPPAAYEKAIATFSRYGKSDFRIPVAFPPPIEDLQTLDEGRSTISTRSEDTQATGTDVTCPPECSSREGTFCTEHDPSVLNPLSAITSVSQSNLS